MRSGNDAVNPLRLPAELVPDYERLRASLLDYRDLPEGALDRLREYGILLHEKAAGLAIISKGDRSQVFTRHILDSLNPVSLFRSAPASALDIGSGGGLPGIPLAIAWPGTGVTLLEARERKAGFLEQAARSLRLPNVTVACARLEDVEALPGGRVEVVFVRALGGLPAVLAQASRFAAEGGRWIYFLGERTPEEVLGDGRRWGGEVTKGAFGGRLLVGSFQGSRT